jgi:tetratricopeptide (TPR) repeat protein
MNDVLSVSQLIKDAKSAYKRGSYLESARLYNAAADSYRTSGDALMAAEMCNNSSVAYLQGGDAQAALAAVQDTPDQFAAEGDLRRQGLALGNLASALEGVGRLDEAMTTYQQSAEVLQQAGETQLRSTVLQSLSALQLRTGHQLEALATMQAGIEQVEKPTVQQRALKKLLRAPFKFLNGS